MYIKYMSIAYLSHFSSSFVCLAEIANISIKFVLSIALIFVKQMIQLGFRSLAYNMYVYIYLH